MTKYNSITQYPFTILTVDAPCGAGKTYSLSKALSEQTLLLNNIIAVPTKVLAAQYSTTLNSFNHKHRVIDGNHTQHPTRELYQDIICKKSKTIVTTQSSFNLVGADCKDTTVTFDEIPAVDFHYALCIPNNHKMLTNLLEINHEYKNDNLYRLQIKQSLDPKDIDTIDDIPHAIDVVKTFNTNKMHTIVHRNTDDIDNIFKPILKHLIDEDLVFVTKKSWDKVTTNQITNDDEVDMTYGNKENTLYFLAISSPKKYDDIGLFRIMGANLKHSMLYKLWSELFGVKFQRDIAIEKSLRYTTHANGELLDIKYCSYKSFSLTQANKQIDEKSIAQSMIDLAVNYFNHDPVLFFMNDSIKKQNLYPDTFVECPLVAHGLNKYDNHTNLFFGAACNRNPMHIYMLNQMGVSSDFIQRSMIHEIMYQDIMRGCLRKPDNTQVCKVVVADKAMADALARLFPGCLVGAIDGVSKRTTLAKDRISKSKSKMELLEEAAKSLIYIAADDATNLISNRNVASSAATISHIHTNYYSNIYQSGTEVTEILPPHKWASMMESFSYNNIIKNKHDNQLLNNTIFTSTDTRKKDNAVYTTTIVLDIDDGELSHQECHRIFSEVYPISHIMHNSASATTEQDKYRVFFFVKTIMTPDVYNVVFDYIIQCLEKQGYYTAPQADKENYITTIIKKYPMAKFTGIDMSKKNLSSLFYMPATLVGHEKSRFFYRFRIKDIFELKKYAIDPYAIVQQSTIEEPMAQIVEVKEIIEEDTIDFTNTKQYYKVIDLIEQMHPGNRSSLAVQIAGKIKHWDSNLKNSILQKVIAKGIDKSCIEQFKKYMQ